MRAAFKLFAGISFERLAALARFSVLRMAGIPMLLFVDDALMHSASLWN